MFAFFPLLVPCGSPRGEPPCISRTLTSSPRDAARGDHRHAPHDAPRDFSRDANVSVVHRIDREARRGDYQEHPRVDSYS